MKKLIIGLLLIAGNQTFGQNITLPVNMVKAYLDETSKEKIEDLDILLNLNVSNDELYEFTLHFADTTKTFQLNPFIYQDFEEKLNNSLKTILKWKGYSTVQPNESLLKNYVPSIYAQIAVYNRVEENKPLAATVYLQDSIPAYIKFRKNDFKKNEKNDSTEVDEKNVLVGFLNDVNVEIAFKDGFIQKIQVRGRINKNSPLLVFENKFSIGISSSYNISRLYKIPLRTKEKYTFNEVIRSYKSLPAKLDSIGFSPKNIKDDTEGFQMKIYVGSVIQYLNKIDLNANDLSPAATVIELNNKQKEVKLFKEESSKLFQARIYSDLLGLLGENNPNGIVQIEVNKKFNIFTKMGGDNATGTGCLHYFNTIFTFSKIESENKFASPLLSYNGENPSLYFPSLKLMQYRNYSVGGMLNLFYLENQNLKFNFNIDAGLIFGRSGVYKTETDSSGYFTNCIELPFEYGFHLVPEKRIELHIKDKTSFLKSLDEDINTDKDHMARSNYSNLLHTFQMGINLDLSDSGKLFFRYKFIHDWSNWNYNFSQLQFGYSFYILKNNKTKFL